MLLSREEKVIILIIVISLISGCLIYFFTSFKSKIKKENIILTSTYVNINKADIDELDKLPGIGKTIAKRIVDYRGKNNGFKNIEELRNIKGITNKKLEKIKQYIKIE
jgi:comEA protein